MSTIKPPTTATTNKTGRTVIVTALDRTATSELVLASAASLARAIPNAELHALHVVPFDVGLPEGAAFGMRDLMEEGRVFLGQSIHNIKDSSSFEGRVHTHLAMGNAARRILQLATDLEADFIVVGSHGKKALARLLLGSVSEGVLKQAQCTVIVVRPKDYADGAVPEIEPACKACLETQRASDGEKLWCKEHSARHAHAQLHYETPAPFAVGSMFIRSES